MPLPALEADPSGEDGSFSLPQNTKLKFSVNLNMVEAAYIQFFFLTSKYKIAGTQQAQLFPFILIFYD